MLPSLTESQPCIMCNHSNAKFCSSCHSISYCSSKCQKDDWSLHKTICKAFATVPSRPSPAHKLAILFSVDSKNPQLIWIECERRIDDDDDGVAYQMPLTDDLLDAENLGPKYRGGTEYKPINRNRPRGFSLSYTIQVIIREAFMIDGSSLNQCIQHTTKGRTPHSWSGPIVVMRQPGTDIDNLIYEDVRAGDFRVAIDYFVSYGRDS